MVIKTRPAVPDPLALRQALDLSAAKGQMGTLFLALFDPSEHIALLSA
jgi:hypothetical protein